MDKLTPHIFGILHRLERHLTEIAQFDQKLTLPLEKREYLKIHYPQMKRTLACLRRHAVLMQLSRARKDRLVEHRHIQIFYGMIELVRPEVQAALHVCRTPDGNEGNVPVYRIRAAH